MKGLIKTLITASAGVALGYAAYTFVLTDDQRAQIKDSLYSCQSFAKQAYTLISPVVENLVRPEEVSHVNRDETIKQWESLGY
ncbi:MAG: hypothetical protein ACOX4F_00445 [Atopobiaceae bacterium]